MDSRDVEAVVSRRFRLKHAPTLGSFASNAPVAFTRLRSDNNNHGRAGPVPTEAAFAFQVMLRPLRSWDLLSNRSRSVLPPTKPGDAYLFDLSKNPRISLHTPFDMVRIYLPQQALDDFAYENGLRPVDGLRANSTGFDDPILYGSAIALSAAMERPHEAQALFIDAMALSVKAHVIHAYGGRAEPSRSRGSLAPWQLRRVTEAMEADLSADHAVTALARECGLSADYFIRAFKQSTGLAPHRWLLRRRVERAQVLMRETTSDLTVIAFACGFVDQSHFSRVFTQFVKQSPGRWRRTMMK